METSPIDDLYGDLGQGLHGSALCHDEDSVDIYSGLEDSPRASRGTGKEDHPSISPRRLKESMDLYEELITEEQEEKESTYNELKSKFDSAQNQVRELLAKLEQLHKQNSSLCKENTQLKKNFSALIKTARMEIVRKDEEINQLCNRRSWGGFHQYRVERSPVCTRQGLSRSLGSRMESRGHKEDGTLTEPSPRKDENRLSSAPVCPEMSANAAPSTCSAPPRCSRSDPNAPVHSQNKNCDGVDSLHQKHVQSDQTSVSKEKESACSEGEVLKSYNGITANQKAREEISVRKLDGKEGGRQCFSTQSDKQIDLSWNLECHSKEKNMSGKPQNKADEHQTQKVQREASKMSCASSQDQYHQNEGDLLLRRSGRSKSPSSQPQPVPTPKLHSQTSRGPSRKSINAQTQGQKVELGNRGEDGRGGESKASGDRRGACGPVSEKIYGSKPGLFTDRNVEKRGTREHHRKEERRAEDVLSSERRRTRSDGSREHKNTRQSDGRNRQEGSSGSRGDRRSTRSETSKDHGQRSTKASDRGITSGAVDKPADKRDMDRRKRSHSDVRESRRDTSVNHGFQCNDPTQRKDHEQDDDKRKASGRTEEQSARSAVPCGYSRDGKNSYSQASHANSASDTRNSVKEKCVDVNNDEDRRRTDKGKQITSLDRNSKGGFLAEENTRATSPENCRIDDDGHTSETVQSECIATAQSTLALNGSCDVPAMVEESSPKRKLSFMETLNLTLSPVKKQSQTAALNEPAGPPPRDVLEGSSFEDRVSFELGEEFCVIDEIENSQLSVEAMDESPASDAAPCLAPSSLDIELNKNQDVAPSEPSTSLHDTEVKQKELDLSQRLDQDTNENLEKIATDSEAQEKESTTKVDDSDESATGVSRKCIENSRCVLNEMTVAESEVESVEESEAVFSPSVPLFETGCKDLESQISMNKLEEGSIKDSSTHAQIDNQTDPKVPPLKQSGDSQQEVSTSVDTHGMSKTCCDTDTSLEVVSSTVSLDVKPQNQDFCNDSQTTTTPETEITSFENHVSCPGPLEGAWAEGVKISSTSTEKESLPEQTTSSEPDSTENEGQSSKPSSSTVVSHDEDSMMLILSNIKVIPEAISPLTSPVRQTKKVQEQHLGKELHVKSLGKDFSASAIVSDKDAWKMDMNKENKRPSSAVTPNLLKDQQEPLSSVATEEELEEGEIVSESDEEGALVIQSPQNDETKRELRKQPSPRSPGLEKQMSQTRPAVTPKRREQGRSASTSKDSPTLNKRRFKTVTAPSKASITTSTEFMNMLSFIRSELRRKYMKLHKNVTKTAFCCIVDMSLASFTEFVDSINFHRFCCQGNDIKPRLNKIITSVMSKVSSNGIVNRIFDQRAEDLKQKLWNFVDGQFDFLFKELKAALKSVSELSKNNPRMREGLKVDIHKAQAKEPLTINQHKRIAKANVKQVSADQESQQKDTNSSHCFPCQARGLGSSGKNIKATMEEVPQVPGEQTLDQVSAGSSSEKCVPEINHVLENTASTYTRRLSHSGSVQDRSDFEILTEQQTSSLTFNLVTDSQMGDIFRCLLQGSDLLETNAGDHQNWPLSTPRKESSAAESLIGVITPSKIITPSKLITWTSISPYKFTSPNSKIQMPLNPAFLDESCLLEVPSNPHPNQGSLVPTIGSSQQSSLVPTIGSSQQPFSLLAEDLAVSLTIPSPLKSDGHLSFLHPPSGQPLSVPSSVISAHYGEDALLEGEDATEQDIHLSLDTDISSCGSSTGGTWDSADPVAFQFKPNLPMQAEIMERSNDHFIVRIRQASPGVHEGPAQVQKEAAQIALLEDTQASLNGVSPSEVHPLVTSNEGTEVQTSANGTSSREETSPASVPKTTRNPTELAATDTASGTCASTATPVTAATEEDRASEAKSTCERTSRKRRKHYSGPKEKRSKREKSQDRHQKQRHKKRSKSSKCRGERTPSKRGKKTACPQLSPNSLSAKNVVRKKGAVVVTWTREEDRDILLELKIKGATLKTFTALATKLRKTPAQIEDRFTQLMKLFKKKEKMEC